MKNNIVLIGGGGHSLGCYDVISQNQNFNLVGFVDIRSDVILKDIGCKYLGSDDVLYELIKKRVFFLVSKYLLRKLFGLLSSAVFLINILLSFVILIVAPIGRIGKTPHSFGLLYFHIHYRLTA